jgi:hypothetical protein
MAVGGSREHTRKSRAGLKLLDHEAPSGAEDAVRLAEELFGRFHVMGRANGGHPVHGTVGERDRLPSARAVLDAGSGSWGRRGGADTRLQDDDARCARGESGGERSRAASDVEEDRPRLEVEEFAQASRFRAATQGP